MASGEVLINKEDEIYINNKKNETTIIYIFFYVQRKLPIIYIPNKFVRFISILLCIQYIENVC